MFDLNANYYRSPVADPKSKGVIYGLTLDTSEKHLALLYLATIQGIAYGTRHVVEHCNAHGHKVLIKDFIGLVEFCLPRLLILPFYIIDRHTSCLWGTCKEFCVYPRACRYYR